MSVLKKTPTFSFSFLYGFLSQMRYRMLLLICSGILSAIPLVISELWLLQWIAVLPSALILFALTEENTVRLRTLYRDGLVFFWAFYIVVFHWFIAMYPLRFTGLTEGAAAVVVLLGVFGLSLLQALISAWLFVLFAVLKKSPVLLRFPSLLPLLFATLWTVFEWVHALGWWGVPWARLALGQIDSPLTVRSAELFGSYFVTFVILSVNAYLAYAVLYVPYRKIMAITACGIFLLNLLCGTLMHLIYRIESETQTTVKVAAIQGNIENKWELSILTDIQRVYREQTLLAAKSGAEIVLWPESTLPVDLLNTPSLLDFAKKLAKEANVYLIVGGFHTVTDGNGETSDYNSLFLICPDGTVGETVYDKQHLVPFGEYVPMRDAVTAIFPPLAEVGMLEEDLSHGSAGKHLMTDYGTVGCMICFDSIYENIARSAVQSGAELLCLASNDTWFQDSAAIYMHHDQARLRAIETGRYLVRAGNSGITSIISPEGTVITDMEPLTEGYVIGDVAFLSKRTLYSYIGNAFVYLLLGVTAVLMFTATPIGRKKERSPI